LAQADAALGRLDDTRLENIHETVSEIIEDIASHETEKERQGKPEPRRETSSTSTCASLEANILHTRFGSAGRLRALIVADALKREGYVARVSGADSEIDAGNAETICVCFVEAVSAARAAFTVRKLSRKSASAHVIVCRFADTLDDERGKQPSDDVAPRSLATVIAAVAKLAVERTRREQ
jgi:hypothetical protein